MKASREMKNKFSPLTVLLLIILSLYVLFMLVMLFWALLTSSKAYSGDYAASVLIPGGKPNLIGWPKKFKLFDNIKIINSIFA